MQKPARNTAPNLARNTPRTDSTGRLKAAVQGRDGNALAQALAHLAPGGQLHMVDFGQLERLPSPFRTLLFSWLRRFHVSPRANLPGRLHELSSDPSIDGEFRSLFRGYAWSGTLTRRRADQAV